MNLLSIYTLKALRKLYTKAFNVPALPKPICEQNPDRASRIIYEKLMEDKPCMIARFGAFELATLVNYLGVKQSTQNVLKYIQGKYPQWWWNERILSYMQTNAGFFPPTHDKIEQFCELMLKDMKEVDILGSWLENENYIQDKYSREIVKINRDFMNPFFIENPWTRALENKKVLVIHPFEETIKKQYKNKNLIFLNEFLPNFELKTIKAVQTLAGEKSEYIDWFHALDSMKEEIEKSSFDICLIGAGAYGFPLAAHIKRIGKKSVHIGGTLQLFFGIKGKRWESAGYLGTDRDYSSLYNEYWIRPNKSETPTKIHKVENGCYW